MLILKPGEVCPYKDRCPYTNSCYGIESGRGKKFVCKFVDSNGNIRTDLIDPLKM